jgi:hypothetical protein
MLRVTGKRSRPLPPRLSLKEYCQWIADNLKRVDPVKAKRQKEIEEQINHRFTLKP